MVSLGLVNELYLKLLLLLAVTGSGSNPRSFGSSVHGIPLQCWWYPLILFLFSHTSSQGTNLATSPKIVSFLEYRSLAGECLGG